MKYLVLVSLLLFAAMITVDAGWPREGRKLEDMPEELQRNPNNLVFAKDYMAKKFYYDNIPARKEGRKLEDMPEKLQRNPNNLVFAKDYMAKKFYYDNILARNERAPGLEWSSNFGK